MVLVSECLRGMHEALGLILQPHLKWVWSRALVILALEKWRQEDPSPESPLAVE